MAPQSCATDRTTDRTTGPIGLPLHPLGMYLRIFRDLLLCQKRKRHQQHIILSLSVLEIYNEQALPPFLSPAVAGMLHAVLSAHVGGWVVPK